MVSDWDRCFHRIARNDAQYELAVEAPQAAELAGIRNDRPGDIPARTRTIAVIDHLYAARIGLQPGAQRLECALLGTPDLRDQRVSK
jgi:hypothetical protein